MALDLTPWPQIRAGGDHVRLVLLHGFMGRKEDWLPVMSLLAGRGVASVAFDLPGHGENLGDDSIPSFDVLLSRLHDQLGLLGAWNLHLAGYSMGGRVAVHHALRYPSRCRSLVMISCSPGLEDADVRRARRASDAVLAGELRSGSMSVFLEKWYRQPIFKSLATRPELLHSLMQARAGNHPLLLADALERWSQGVVNPVWQELARIPMPVKWIGGALDESYKDVPRRLKGLLPGLDVDSLEGVGHAVPAEAPDALAGLLAEWIIRNES